MDGFLPHNLGLERLLRQNVIKEEVIIKEKGNELMNKDLIFIVSQILFPFLTFQISKDNDENRIFSLWRKPERWTAERYIFLLHSQIHSPKEDFVSHGVRPYTAAR